MYRNSRPCGCGEDDAVGEHALFKRKYPEAGACGPQGRLP